MIETIRQGLEADGFDVSISKLCRWLDVPRRTVYYRPTKAAPRLQESASLPTGRYLSFAERELIALARARGEGVREIACQLGRAASTISRELRRNAATRCGEFA